MVAAAVDRVLLIGLEDAIAATRSTPDRTFTLEDLYDAVARVEAAAAAWQPLRPVFDAAIGRYVPKLVPPLRLVVTSVF